ncbi:MAG: PocR ligand-binding domain-containing protein [Candidatus Omnitrophica bacterium]|nr:PocR ligand-binding domain-containing protein [Candidatus Omnitrophota bacterium]
MKFSEIIGVNHWQKVQDIFSSIVGMSIRTVDVKGEIVVRPSNVPLVCSEAVAACPAAREKCRQWYPKLAALLKNQKIKKYYDSVCPLGLANFALPLILDNAEPVFLILGPVVLEYGKKDVKLTRRIQETGIAEEKFFNCFNQLPAVSAVKMESVVDFSIGITKFMKTLGSLTTGNEKEKVIFNKEQVGLLLKTFLELAMKLCDAERGSMMLFEKNTQELSIKDSTGLSEDVINNTKIKPGEGLAGLTIQSKKGLFLNEQLSDRELRLRMHKPKIKSAFVIPVFHQDEILGVISVGTAKQPNRFSEKLMELLNELVGMALEKVDLG